MVRRSCFLSLTEAGLGLPSFSKSAALGLLHGSVLAYQQPLFGGFCGERDGHR